MYDEQRRQLLDAYFKYTTEVLPGMASENGWAAMEDAHFQRIILDNVLGGVWYGRVREPAILHLSKTQLKKAARMAQDLAEGRISFDMLNEQSLAWREEKGVPPQLELYRKPAPEEALPPRFRPQLVKA
jgi:hypothetical protein